MILHITTNQVVRPERGVVHMATTTTQSITWAPASEAGALDSWGATCTECGMPVRSSLESLARQWVREHAEWHARQAMPVKARKAAARKAPWER
jgi:hypothetical protein